jgi:hypothetical protein
VSHLTDTDIVLLNRLRAIRSAVQDAIRREDRTEMMMGSVRDAVDDLIREIEAGEISASVGWCAGSAGFWD